MAGRGSPSRKIKQPRRRRATARGLSQGAEQLRRGGGLRRMPDLLSRVLEPAARRRGLAEAKLLTEWPSIVGPALAARCHPIRLSQSSERSGATLSLHVAGAAALELQHSAPQIVERINGFFGYHAVGRLRLIQAPLPRRNGSPPPPVRRSILDAEETEIAQAVRAIHDPGLRLALQGLGRTLKSWPDGGREPEVAR